VTEEKKPEEGAPKADPKEDHPKAVKPKESEDSDPGDEAAPEGDKAADKPKKKHWAEKRFEELTYHRRQAERDRDYWRELATKQASQPQQQPAQTQAQATTKPSASQFQTTEDYLEALADWKSDQKLQDWDRKRREETEKREKEERQQKVARTFSEREQKARDKYEDYQEVAYGDDNPISELMAKAIYASEMGPDVAYYLGKNPDKALQIAQMPDPSSVALAIGRIEAQIEAAATPPAPAATSTPKAAPTAAPPPPKVLSTSAPTQKKPDDMTTAEWMDWRNSQLRKKRQRA
jgi:hypothetical protein